MIRSGFVLAAAVLFSLCTGVNAGELRAGAVAVADAETTVELVSLDRAKRLAVVRGPDGATVNMQIPAEAQNLDRVKPGDKFKVRYVEALALSLHKGGAASATGMKTVKLAPKGGTPGGIAVSTRELTTVVTDIDRANRTIAVQGPLKNTVKLKVADEVRSFDDIKVGDTISLTYAEAVMLEMIVK